MAVLVIDRVDGFFFFFQVDTTTKSNEPQSSCSSLYVRPPNFTNTKVRNRLDEADEPTAHIIQKSLYRPHIDAAKTNATANTIPQRNDYLHGSDERQPESMQINRPNLPRPAQSRSSLPQENRDGPPSGHHPNPVYTPSDRTNPTLFNPLQAQTDKGRYHMVHKSYDDLYQRSSTMSPLHNQYLPASHAFPNREQSSVVVQNAQTAKLPRHFGPFTSSGKMSTPPSNDPNASRQTNDLTIYPRSQSANLFYHEQNRIKPIRDMQSTSSSPMNAYNYAPSNATKSHEYYSQMNVTHQKWSGQTRVSQSPIAAAPSPHGLSNHSGSIPQSPISASPLPYPMHRQNPSVNYHTFFHITIVLTN